MVKPMPRRTTLLHTIQASECDYGIASVQFAPLSGPEHSSPKDRNKPTRTLKRALRSSRNNERAHAIVIAAMRKYEFYLQPCFSFSSGVPQTSVTAVTPLT